MYMAGRLRTASSPPRTLIEVASYLCPEAGISFSAMKYASPQMLHAAVVLVIRGKAVARIRPRLALPIGPCREKFSPDLGLEGCSGFHPVPFRIFRADAAKLHFPNQGISSNQFAARLSRCVWRDERKPGA